MIVSSRVDPESHAFFQSKQLSEQLHDLDMLDESKKDGVLLGLWRPTGYSAPAKQKRHQLRSGRGNVNLVPAHRQGE